MSIPFYHEGQVEHGVLQPVSPMIRRIVAKNAGPFTYHGTNTYVIGHGRVAVIDAGPPLPEHIEALLGGLRDEEITHQLVTHTHCDHSPGARLLRDRSGAKTYGFGPHGLGQYERGTQVEAGADFDFIPDEVVGHGEVIHGNGWSVECVHTPGHCSNHLCFQLREDKALFTGDLVMGWSTSIISPPDGNMGDYMASLALLLARDDHAYWPAHGPVVPDPKPFVRAFIEHREQREAQVIACLEGGIDRIADMVPKMYTEIPEFMHPAAARSVFAHVLHMLDKGVIQCDGPPSLTARYRLDRPVSS